LALNGRSITFWFNWVLNAGQLMYICLAIAPLKGAEEIHLAYFVGRLMQAEASPDHCALNQ
jgi:hypothetical protein